MKKIVKMNEKHLEFIQGVITRHNSNSFMIKGWVITITAAIFALTGTIKEPYLCFISLGPIAIFWILDSIYLANERCFVSLYSYVANGNKKEVKEKDLRKKFRNKLSEGGKLFEVTDFSMNFATFRKIKRNNWWSTLFSSTILWFYLGLIVLTILTFWGLNSLEGKDSNQVINVNASIVTEDSIRIAPLEIRSNVDITDTINLKTSLIPSEE